MKRLERVADTLLDQSIEIVINVRRLNILQRLGFLKKQKIYQVRKLTLGALIAVSRELVNVNIDIESPDLWNELLKQMPGNVEALARIVAIVLSDTRNQPPSRIVAFVKDNMTANDLMHAVIAVVESMDVKSFMSSIISIKGMSLLKQGS